MNRITSISVATFMIMAAPSMAQEDSVAQENNAGGHDMSTSQHRMIMHWPEDKRITYAGWPEEHQTYYWTLTPQQQTGWWILTDEQRNRIYVATPEQRAREWVANAARVTSTPSTQTPTQMAGTTMSGGIRWVSNPVVQQIPPPHNGEYPVCKSDRDDNCMNPWEAGLRGPNVERPLEYWPGRPASEM